MNKKNFLISAAVVLTIVIALASSAYLSTFYYTNKSVPGQSYNNTSISGLTYPQLLEKTEQIQSKTLQTPVQVSIAEQDSILFLQDLVEPISVEDVNSQTKFFKGRPSISQVVYFLRNKTNKTSEFQLKTNLSDVVLQKFPNIPQAKNASFANDLTIISEQSGEVIDTETFTTDLNNSFKKPLSKIKLSPTLQAFEPSILASDLEQYLANIQSISEQNITLTSEEIQQDLNILENIDKVVFSKTEEGVVDASFDQSFLTSYLNETVKPLVYKAPQDLQITYDTETKKAVFGDESQKGVDIDIEGNIENINTALDKLFANPANKQTLIISTLALSPNISVDDYLKDKGITELVATGYTTFRGSTGNRIHNINVGMEKFNGLIIPQGEEFSFNDHLGPVDASTGYRPELVIKSFGTIPEYGGGLCQVSSTMYRAALYSGLEITERDNHSYAVGYYAQVLGHGLDATIYPGVKDLKFVNNSNGDLVVHAYTIGTAAYFDFYGTKHIDRVELVGPINSNYRSPGAKSVTVDPNLPAGTIKYMDSPVTGFDSYWERLIYDKDNNVTKEEIFSDYRAVNEKVIVSPDYYGTPDTEPGAGETESTEPVDPDLA